MIVWPDLNIPSINLNVLPPARWFYATAEEKKEWRDRVLTTSIEPANIQANYFTEEKKDV